MGIKIRFATNKAAKPHRSATMLGGASGKDIAERTLEKYSEISSWLTGVLGCVQPIWDPYLLSTLADSNGYHASAMRLKAIMTVGAGWYTESKQLEAWINNLETENGFQSLLNDTQQDYEIFGNLFVEVQPGISTFGLYRVPTIRTRIRPESDNSPLLYCQYAHRSNLKAGAPTYFEKYDGDSAGVWHMRGYSKNGDDFYGEPRYTSVIDPLKINVSIIDYMLKMFKQGLMADLLLILKGTMIDNETREQVQNYLRANFRGLENAHKVGWLEIGQDEEVDVHKLSPEIMNKSFADTRVDLRDEIAQGHDMPKRLLGIIAAGGLGGAGEVEGQLKIVKLTVVDPGQVEMESRWQRLFKTMGAPDWNTFKLKPLDVTAGSLDMQTLATGVQTGIVSLEDAQEEYSEEKSDRISEIRAREIMMFMGKLRKALGYLD